jgi:flagellin
VYTLTVGTVQVFTKTAAGTEGVTAAEIDAAIASAPVAAALTAAGISFSGTTAAGLTATKADGTDLTITVTNTGAGGDGFATWAASNTATNGTPAVPGTPAAATVGAMSIQVGTNTAVNIASASYATADALATAINSAVSGVYASIDSTNHLVIASGEALTITGAGATTTGNASAALSGTLSGQNVLNVAGANSAIQSVDAALTSVSNLRSTLGAIQNRFQSVINSLQAVSENLSASRSRILDTDYAMETASLTRAQILQQAGTAMVAQANSAPQNVLSLLRG